MAIWGLGSFMMIFAGQQRGVAVGKVTDWLALLEGP